MSGAARDRLKLLVITGLGTGLAPFATGTWGSLLAAVMHAGALLGARGAWWPRGVVEGCTLAGAAVGYILAVRWGSWAVARFRSDDPKPFTLDEFVGQWIALLALPVDFANEPFLILAAVVGGQFLLFRFFDIVKLAPARQAESLPGGWGVATDDVIAGAYANLAGQALWRFTPMASWLAGLGLPTH